MPNSENDTLADSLQGYKEKITPVTKATLMWNRELIFTGSTPQGYEIEFDANSQWGCKPTEALLLSLAGCMGIDVVMMLQKMRVALSGFTMDITGQRNPDPPQYFKAVEIVLHIAGKGIEPHKVERAVSLSREKYCSVYNSLRKDLALTVRWELAEAAEE
jgi:putative redox protein